MTWDPCSRQLQHELGPAARVWPLQEERENSMLLVTTDAWVESHAAEAGGGLRALVAAEEWARANPAELAAWTAATFGYDPACVAYALPRTRLVVSLPQKLILEMEEQARWKASAPGDTSGGIPNFLELVSLGPLHAVRPEAVGVIH